MNMLIDSMKKYFGKREQTEEEKTKGIISRFAGGLPYTDDEILYVVLHIKQDSPEDSVINLLKQSGKAAEFKKEAVKIFEAMTENKEKWECIRQTYELSVQKLNNMLHENREIPLSDDFFAEMRNINNGITKYFLYR